MPVVTGLTVPVYPVTVQPLDDRDISRPITEGHEAVQEEGNYPM